jgi:ArsR family transcriptional regulator
MPPAIASDLSTITRQFRALADPTRLRIVDLLRGGERCVCELTDALDAGQSLLSFHLKALKDAGLVSDRRDGRWAYYSINADAFAQLEEFVGALPSTKLSANVARCCG